MVQVGWPLESLDLPVLGQREVRQPDEGRGAPKRIDEFQEMTGRGKKDEDGSKGTLTRLPRRRRPVGRGGPGLPQRGPLLVMGNAAATKVM
jgi:hypothetical protein